MGQPCAQILGLSANTSQKRGEQSTKESQKTLHGSSVLLHADLCGCDRSGSATDREREEYEQEQNANNNHETTEPTDTSNPDLDIPPVIVPDDTGDESIKDDIILDVSNMDRDPNPGVVDATIEYDTKEGANNE